MRAGRISKVSVSPIAEEAGDEGSGEQGEGDSEGEAEGEIGQRLRLPEEDKFVRRVKDPKLPTREDVESHNVRDHIPYRDWCPVCIKAKGKGLYHHRDKGPERVLPEYAWDYCFPGDELGFKWTVLVGTEKGADCAMATAVPVKGGEMNSLQVNAWNSLRKMGTRRVKL